MGRFTRIPETNLAGTLGGIIGQTTGTVVSTGNLTITNLQNKVSILCSKISTREQISLEEIENIEKTLDKLEDIILTVEKSVQRLNNIISSVRIPVTALKISINIIKYLPLPQVTLTTSVSALQADLVQMLSETVAQIEQIILSLQIIIRILISFLDKIKALISKLRKVLSTLKAFQALQGSQISDQDLNTLQRIGIIDRRGNNLFGQLAKVINGQSSEIIWIGNYSSIGIESTVTINLVRSAESGTTIKIPTRTVGNWITTVYKFSVEKPEKPVGSNPVPKGWNTSLVGAGWSSRGTVSGLTGKVLSWTEPIRSLGGREQRPVVPETEDVNVFRMTKDIFTSYKFNQEEANAIILNPDEAYSVTLNLLQSLDQAPISSTLKEQLNLDIHPEETQLKPEDTQEWYISRSGDRYLMTLKISTVSPKIATLRYVEVTDESGVIVYEGTQTFAVDPKVLFEETRVRLTQLLG